ncbi:MAG: hypothetical protein FIA97_07655 [Methylococcaceae bacterium]|nr:hypothetical protein [Methylococcaceae bacterium]
MDEFDELLGNLYECSAGVGDWNALASDVANYLRADKCNIFSPPNGTSEYGIWHAYGVELQAWQDYLEYYALCDVLVRKAFEQSCRQIGDVFSDELLITKHELVRTEFYRDFWAPLGIHSSLSALVCAQESNGMPRVVLSLYRPPECPGFASEEYERTMRLLPHLQRALRLHHLTRDLQAKAALGQQAVDALNVPMLIVDGQGRLLHWNSGAKQLLDTGHSGLVVKSGRISTARVGDKVKLGKLLADATGKAAVGGAMFISSPKDTASWNLFVAPLPGSSPLSGDRQIPLVLLLLVNQALPLTPLKLVGRLYGLSPAEVRLAAALMEGISPEAHAESMRVSISTVRTQLRSLFAKTNTRRQGELIALLNRAPPLAFPAAESFPFSASDSLTVDSTKS